MIDTDKYEGHTEGKWDLHSMGDGWTIGQLKKIDRTLMQDAPLLLAEVKRLREELDGRVAYIKRLSGQLARASKWAYKQVLHNDSAMINFDDYVWVNVWGEQE